MGPNRRSVICRPCFFPNRFLPTGGAPNTGFYSRRGSPRSMASSRLFGMWYHPLYTDGIHPEARFRDRYQLLLDRFEASSASESMHITQPQPVAKSLLLLAHGVDYADRFLAGELSEKEEKRIGLTPWTPAMIETQVLIGGAVEATEHAVRHGGFSGNMAGGTHHAHRDFGSGYCVFKLGRVRPPCAGKPRRGTRGRRRPRRASGRRDGDHSCQRASSLHDFGSLFNQLPLPKIRQRPRPPRAPRIRRRGLPQHRTRSA